MASVVAVPRSEVKQWVQPPPLITFGEADVAFNNSPTGVSVRGFATAVVVPSARLLAAVVVSGVDAAVVVNVDGQLFPRPVGSASVVFDNTADAQKNWFYRDAVADVVLSSSSGLTVETEGTIGAFIFGFVDAAVVSQGSAQVAMEYYGDGSVPIFPFKLPFLFLPIDFSNLDAAALLDFVGTADDFTPAAIADSVLRFTGDVELGLKGSTPIFPYRFPLVFTDQANDNSAYAEVGVQARCVVGVEVDGGADLDVGGVVSPANPGIFPLVFPFVLQQIIAGAVVVLTSVEDVTVLVDGSAEVDVYTVAVTEIV